MLLCALFIRDSVSLLMFPFLSHVQVFSCDVSLVPLLKYLFSCFSSYFYFLVFFFFLLMLALSILFLQAVSSLLHFVKNSSSLCIKPSFFFTHIVCLHRFWDVKPYVSSLVSLFFGPFLKVPPSFTSRTV